MVLKERPELPVEQMVQPLALRAPPQELARPEPQALEARQIANFLDHSLLIHPFQMSLCEIRVTPL